MNYMARREGKWGCGSWVDADGTALPRLMSSFGLQGCFVGVEPFHQQLKHEA